MTQNGKINASWLKDITIVDLTRILSGPYCTMYFADMGANVIKVEAPSGDDTRAWGPPFQGDESSYYLSVNRSKRSIVLNLKSPEGKEVLRRLVIKADVVVENFRPGTLEKLGFSYEELKLLNPKIILASISGFGQTGMYRNDPGYDIVAQGMGGLMSVTGQEDAPPVKVGFSMADIGSGMWAIIGIQTALLNRELTGQGEWIDVSLLETIISWQTYLAGNFFASGINPVAMGSAHPSICPYQAFRAKDGYFILAVGNDKLWAACCRVLGELDWISDGRFVTNRDRVNNSRVLVSYLEERFQHKAATEWVTLFKQAKIPCGPINRLSEILSDPYVMERNLLRTVLHPTAGEVKMIMHPVKFQNHTDSNDVIRPPLLGEHTGEILKELGFLVSEIDQQFILL